MLCDIMLREFIYSQCFTGSLEPYQNQPEEKVLHKNLHNIVKII